MKTDGYVLYAAPLSHGRVEGLQGRLVNVAGSSSKAPVNRTEHWPDLVLIPFSLTSISRNTNMKIKLRVFPLLS